MVRPIVQFAISTYGRRAHPAYPGRFDVFVDTNNDGKPDFHISNSEFGPFDSNGITVIAVDDLSTSADDAKPRRFTTTPTLTSIRATSS